MFGERLRLARRKAGLSLRGLSVALDGSVSAQSIGKYERGEMTPSFEILTQLADVLEVSLHYMMSEQVAALENIEVRKTSGISAREKAQVEAVVVEKLESYLAIEEIIGIEEASRVPPESNSRFFGREEDGEILAEDMRKEWNLGTNPVSNMTALLENHGIKVLLGDLPEKVSGLACTAHSSRRDLPVPVIVVNKNITLERRRLTLAHKLGHRLIDASSPVNHEKAANVFAGAFLVPKDHLVGQVGKNRNFFCFKELILLKHMYRVSAAAMLVRLRQADVIDKSTLSYAFQTYARNWRSSEPYPLEPDEERGNYEASHRFERLCYWALAEKLIMPMKACELLQLPMDKVKFGMKGPSR